jgi:hypothetical protein
MLIGNNFKSADISEQRNPASIVTLTTAQCLHMGDTFPHNFQEVRCRGLP